MPGTRLIAKTIFIAGGVGSFQPRALKIEGIDGIASTQLFYRVRDPAQFAGKHIVIVGGGDSALDWALNFARTGRTGRQRHARAPARRLSMPRRPAWRACSELCDAGKMQFVDRPGRPASRSADGRAAAA